jgi:hypothetical protein
MRIYPDKMAAFMAAEGETHFPTPIDHNGTLLAPWTCEILGTHRFPLSFRKKKIMPTTSNPMVPTSAVHGVGQGCFMCLKPAHLQITHEASGNYGALPKPPANFVNRIVQLFAAEPFRRIIEHVKLHRLITRHEIDGAYRQGPHRFRPPVIPAKEIPGLLSNFIRALGGRGYRPLILLGE